jgi:putative sigma-54 modulation protein
LPGERRRLHRQVVAESHVPTLPPEQCWVGSGQRTTTTKEAAMRLQVKGKNVEVSPSIREYAERKLVKLSKQLAEQTQVELELSEQRNPSIAACHVAEGTIFTKGPTLRAKESSPDMKASIDQLVVKLERQVKKYRERRTVEPRRHGPHHGVAGREGADHGTADHEVAGHGVVDHGDSAAGSTSF